MKALPDNWTLPGESWKSVVGYEGLYEVSDFGRVRSLDRITCAGHSRNGVVLKATNNSCGYPSCSLYRDGKASSKTVHRLVAVAFLRNPCKFPEINHIDLDKENNFLRNLEWCNRARNMEHCWNSGGEAAENIRYSIKINGKMSGIPISKFSIDGEYIQSYPSTKDAARRHGIPSTGISNNLAGRTNTSGGYIWRYEPNFSKEIMGKHLL